MLLVYGKGILLVKGSQVDFNGVGFQLPQYHFKLKEIALPLKLKRYPGGTQIWFGRECAADAAKPLSFFRGHFG